MSRRAKPTFTNQHFRDLVVVCTRRGTHKPKRIGSVRVHLSLDFETHPNNYRLLVKSHFNESRAFQMYEGPDRDLGNVSHHAVQTDPLTCTKCQINVPMRRDRLDGVVQKLVSEGVWTLDISYLPDML